MVFGAKSTNTGKTATGKTPDDFQASTPRPREEFNPIPQKEMDQSLVGVFP